MFLCIREFFVDNLEILNPLAPGTERIALGKCPYSGGGGTILKNCATLAQRGWAIYIAKAKHEQDTAEYGVFRSLRHSFSITAEESMKDLGETSPVLLLRNRGHFVVELVNTKDERYTVAFTSAPAASSRTGIHVRKLVEAAATRLEYDHKSRFIPYFERIVVEVLQRCHGTLIAVIDPKKDVTVQSPFGTKLVRFNLGGFGKTEGSNS